MSIISKQSIVLVAALAAFLTALLPASSASAAPASLRGHAWQLHSIVTHQGGDAWVTPVARRSSAALRVRPRTVRFDTGCNTGGGDVRVRPGRMRISRVVVTARGCFSKPARVERKVLRVLRGGVRWETTRNQLRVVKMTPSGSITLVYRLP